MNDHEQGGDETLGSVYAKAAENMGAAYTEGYQAAKQRGPQYCQNANAAV